MRMMMLQSWWRHGSCYWQQGMQFNSISHNIRWQTTVGCIWSYDNCPGLGFLCDTHCLLVWCLDATHSSQVEAVQPSTITSAVKSACQHVCIDQTDESGEFSWLFGSEGKFTVWDCSDQHLMITWESDQTVHAVMLNWKKVFEKQQHQWTECVSVSSPS